MQKFFKSFLCCGGTANIESSAISAPINLVINPNQDRQINEIQIELKKEPSEKRIARVNSQYCPKTLQCSNFRPTGGENLRYNCPICFRFFDKILVTSCCKNYLCHYCIEDLNMKVTNADKVCNTRCPFCSNEEFTLKDVDPLEKPKRYTDSPAVSIKSRLRTSSQLSDQLTGKLRHKTIGRLELSRVEDVATAGFEPNRKEISRFGSEGIGIDSEEENLQNSISKRCATEPVAVSRRLLMSQDIEEALRRARNESGRESQVGESIRLARTRFAELDDEFIIPEVPVALEATPHLPNDGVYKKSYEATNL